MKKKSIIILIAMFVIMAQDMCAQGFALKTNLLSDGFLNINLGAEVGLAKRWTLEADGEFNDWKLSHNRMWKHWAAQPEARYWFCDRFGGHFIGLHVHGGQYNIGGFDGWYNILGTDATKLKDSRYEGWFIGGGFSYGYDFILGRHWNLEGEIGIGYSYTRYDRYECEVCNKRVEHGKSHNYVGPTRLAINLVYLF